MTRFKINLIKDMVVPPAHRRWGYWSVLAYLLLCGVSLVWVCFRASKDLMALREQRSQVEAAEGVLLEGGPIPQQIAALYADLEHSAATLERIKKVMEQRFFLVPVVLGVVRPLTPGTRLTRLEVETKSGLFSFELVIPAAQTNQTLHTGGLLAEWDRDPALLQQVSDLRLSTTQQAVIDDRGFLIMKFEGSLRHIE